MMMGVDGVRAILIAGPTASGKSGAALAMAERLGGVIVNTDSMQVYEDLRILTARPDADDEARAPHDLYGFVPAAVAYNVGRWRADAATSIATAERDGRIPIFVGGTGLYFGALLDGLSPIPDIPESVREHWRGEAKRLGGPALHRELSARDPVMAARLRPSDPQRIVRALEVFEATDRSLAEWQNEPGESLLASEETLRFVLAPDRAWLHAKIDRRFDTMIAHGALGEVEALRAMQLDPGLPAMRAHGVPPLIAHLNGATTLDAAVATAKAETRQYAKRQFTWLKRNMIAWNWLFEQDMERINAEIFSFIDH